MNKCFEPETESLLNWINIIVLYISQLKLKFNINIKMSMQLKRSKTTRVNQRNIHDQPDKWPLKASCYRLEQPVGQG